MAMWEFRRVDDALNLHCNFTHHCEFHPEKPTAVQVRKVNKFRFDIQDGREGHACDLVAICPYCGSITYFGLAVSEEEYKHIYGLDTKSDGEAINKKAFDEGRTPSRF